VRRQDNKGVLQSPGVAFLGPGDEALELLLQLDAIRQVEGVLECAGG
jgi:hypothetical protein